MTRPYNFPGGRPWPPDCLWPRKRHQDGRRSHTVLADCAFWTSYPHWFPWPEGFQVIRQEKTLAPAQALQMLCREVGDTSQNHMWCSMGLSKVYGAPDMCGWAWNHRSFTVRTCRWQTQNVPHTRRRGCTAGGWTRASGGSESYHVPLWTPGVPKPKEPAEQSDALCPPAPSVTVPSSSSSQSRDARRTQYKARTRHLVTLDPLTNPNEWVLAYMAEKEKIPSWWPEFWSLHHNGAGPLSDAQVQEFARKQVMGFRLPTTKKEKASCGAPPSLVGLRHRDFLPSLPPRIQGLRDIWVVRHNETLALAQAFQQSFFAGLEPLIERDDLLDASMLEVAEEEPVTSPNPAGEGRLVGEESEPKEEWTTASHIHDQPEEASESEGVISSGVMADAGRQLSLSLPGFAEPLAIKSGPPPFKDADSLVGIPWGLARSNLSRINADDHHPEHLDERAGVLLQNQGHFQDALHLTPPNFPDQPGPNQEHEEPWVNCSKTLRKTLNQVSTCSWNWTRL